MTLKFNSSKSLFAGLHFDLHFIYFWAYSKFGPSWIFRPEITSNDLETIFSKESDFISIKLSIKFAKFYFIRKDFYFKFEIEASFGNKILRWRNVSLIFPNPALRANHFRKKLNHGKFIVLKTVTVKNRPIIKIEKNGSYSREPRAVDPSNAFWTLCSPW